MFVSYLHDHVSGSVVLFEGSQTGGGGWRGAGLVDLDLSLGRMQGVVVSDCNSGGQVLQMSRVEQTHSLARNQVCQPRHILRLDTVRGLERNWCWLLWLLLLWLLLCL